MQQFIVVIGLLRDGFRVVGPFATEEAALAFADRCDDATEIMGVDPPEMFDEESCAFDAVDSSLNAIRKGLPDRAV